MAQPILVQGDTRPLIRAVLYERFTVPKTYINLTSAAVRFQMRKADDKYFTVNGEAVITSAPSGGVSYQLATNDLQTPGEYQVQWEVTFPDGKVQTTSVPNLVTVRRQ